MAFWGIFLEPGAKYSVTLPFDLAITSAIIDSDAKEGERVDVYMEMEEEMFILASLRPPYRDQTPLDLRFEAGDDIALLVRGPSGVSLTGYYIENDLDDHYYLSGDEEEEESGEGEEDEDEDEDDEEIDSDELESDDESDYDMEDLDPKLREELEQVRSETVSYAKSIPSKKQKKQKKIQVDSDEEEESSGLEEEWQKYMDDIAEGRASFPSSDEDEEESSSEDDEDEEVIVKEQQPSSSAQQKKRKRLSEAAAAPAPSTPTLASKKNTKSKTPSTPVAGAEAASSRTPSKKAKVATPSASASAGASTPKTATTTPKKESAVVRKKLGQGLECDVLRVGNGKEARKGQKVTCSYKGSLRKTGKVFDSSNNFSFRLGVGEVIKGWDAGIAGMRVGEKRRLYVPAHLGYGKRGAGRDIPPNSALVFDVELKNC